MRDAPEGAGSSAPGFSTAGGPFVHLLRRHDDPAPQHARAATDIFRDPAPAVQRQQTPLRRRTDPVIDHAREQKALGRGHFIDIVV